MKKIILLIPLLLTSGFCNAYTHQPSASWQQLAETTGILQAIINQCHLNPIDIKTYNQESSEALIAVNYFGHIDNNIALNISQTAAQYYQTQPKSMLCSLDERIDISSFVSDVNRQRLYNAVQAMPQKDLPQLNKEYIYQKGFVPSQITRFSAGFSQGKAWVGEAQDPMSCSVLAMESQNAWCSDGYFKKWVSPVN